MRKLLEEVLGKKSTVVVNFGRLCPPSVGHAKLARTIKDIAEKYDAFPCIYLSHSYDGIDSSKFKYGKTKNPLKYNDKLRFVRDAIGDIITVVESDANKTFEVYGELYRQGFKNLIIVGGADRKEKFETEAKAHNGKDDPEPRRYFDFDSITAVSAGERDPDSEDELEQASASLLRKCALDHDYEKFEKFAGTKTLTKEMWDLLNKEMGITKLEESKLIERKSPIAKKEINEWEFERKSDAENYIEDLNNKYTKSSFNTELFKDGRKFVVKVEAITKSDTKEVKPEEKKPTIQIRTSNINRPKQTLNSNIDTNLTAIQENLFKVILNNKNSLINKFTRENVIELYKKFVSNDESVIQALSDNYINTKDPIRKKYFPALEKLLNLNQQFPEIDNFTFYHPSDNNSPAWVLWDLRAACGGSADTWNPMDLVGLSNAFNPNEIIIPKVVTKAIMKGFFNKLTEEGKILPLSLKLNTQDYHIIDTMNSENLYSLTNPTFRLNGIYMNVGGNDIEPRLVDIKDQPWTMEYRISGHGKEKGTGAVGSKGLGHVYVDSTITIQSACKAKGANARAGRATDNINSLIKEYDIFYSNIGLKEVIKFLYKEKNFDESEFYIALFGRDLKDSALNDKVKKLRTDFLLTGQNVENIEHIFDISKISSGIKYMSSFGIKFYNKKSGEQVLQENSIENIFHSILRESADEEADDSQESSNYLKKLSSADGIAKNKEDLTANLSLLSRFPKNIPSNLTIKFNELRKFTIDNFTSTKRQEYNAIIDDIEEILLQKTFEVLKQEFEEYRIKTKLDKEIKNLGFFQAVLLTHLSIFIKKLYAVTKGLVHTPKIDIHQIFTYMLSLGNKIDLQERMGLYIRYFKIS